MILVEANQAVPERSLKVVEMTNDDAKLSERDWDRH